MRQMFLTQLLHRGGPFINSLLHLEELGFRSSSPIIKKIAFIAWKSLIDNFALNPGELLNPRNVVELLDYILISPAPPEEILCSGKRMKLLMQPLTSINVRTEALLLTKVEVWWYLIVQLGPNLSSNFDQVIHAPPLLSIIEGLIYLSQLISTSKIKTCTIGIKIGEQPTISIVAFKFGTYSHFKLSKLE